jgi:hypothetical protein
VKLLKGGKGTRHAAAESSATIVRSTTLRAGAIDHEAMASTRGVTRTTPGFAESPLAAEVPEANGKWHFRRECRKESAHRSSQTRGEVGARARKDDLEEAKGVARK